MSSIIPIERIESCILSIRGKYVILDRDIATLYGVNTKVFNQAVKRNIKRFPERFMFQLNKEEKDQLVTICDRFKTLKHSSTLPYAFTEHGALMSASILNSETAIQVSIMIIDAFVKMREMLHSNAKFAKELEDLQERMDTQEMNTILIMDKLNNMNRIQKTVTPKKKIGFD